MAWETGNAVAAAKALARIRRNTEDGTWLYRQSIRDHLAVLALLADANDTEADNSEAATSHNDPDLRPFKNDKRRYAVMRRAQLEFVAYLAFEEGRLHAAQVAFDRIAKSCHKQLLYRESIVKHLEFMREEERKPRSESEGDNGHSGKKKHRSD